MKNKLSIINRFKDLLTINKTSLEDKANLLFINSLLKEYPVNSLNKFSSAEEKVQYDIIHKIITFSDNIILKHPECLFYINRYLMQQFSNMRTFLDKEKSVYKENKFLNEKYAYYIELLYNKGLIEPLKLHINEQPHFIHIFNEIKNFSVKKFCCDINLLNTQKRKNNDSFNTSSNSLYLDLLYEFNPELHLHSNSTFCSLYISNHNSENSLNSENLSPVIFKNKEIFEYILKQCVIPKNDLFLNIFFNKMLSFSQEQIISEVEFKNNIIIAKPFIENNEFFLNNVRNSIFQHINLEELIILNNETPNFYQAIKEINNISIYKEHIYWDKYEDTFKYFIMQDSINNQNTTKNIANVFILNGNEEHLLFLYNIFKNNDTFIQYLTSLFINSEEHCYKMSQSTIQKIGNNIKNKIPFIEKIINNVTNEDIILEFLISFNELNLVFASPGLDLNKDQNYKDSDSVIHWIFSTFCKTLFSVDFKNYNIFNKIKENYTFENLLFKYIKINKPDFLSNIDFQNTNLNMEDISNLFQNRLLQQTFKIEEKKNKIKRL